MLHAKLFNIIYVEQAYALIVPGSANSISGFALGGVTIVAPHDKWFMTVHHGTHNDHPSEATSLLRKPARLHSTGELELVTAAMSSYAGAGVARSLYYHRTGEVLDYSMIHRLKTIANNSTMHEGSAAQQLISELR